MSALPKSIVFITGTFLGNNCWDEWRVYFESKGYRCLAPAWLSKTASGEELRNRHPDAAIASVRLTPLIDYFSDIIGALPEKPILIGHSLGGLIVQLLLQHKMGSAGVAIHSFPPKSLIPNVSFLRSLRGPAGFLASAKGSYLIPFKAWKTRIANGFTCEEQKQSYYEYAIPESKLVIRDAFGCTGKVDFGELEVPLLFMAGGRDRMVPASLNYGNYKRCSKRNGVTGYMEFAERNHLVFGPSAWKEDAEFILCWLESYR